MSLQAKFSHIRIDERIWDDPVTFGLTPEAFRTFILGIAWSKSQHGRTPDGNLTAHGIARIGCPESALQELVNKRLFTRLEDGSYEIVKYGQWQITSAEEKAVTEQKAESGRLGAAKRWSAGVDPADFPPLEAGFDFDRAFDDSWGDWPKSTFDKGKHERQDLAKEAFRMEVFSEATYSAFSAALQSKLRNWRKDDRPFDEKRKFLGAFRNFCGRWKDWLPENYETLGQPKPATSVLPAMTTQEQSKPLVSTYIPD